MNSNSSGMKRYNAFTSDLMRRYIKNRKGENVILSPLSILALLSIASDATAGETSAEIKNFLDDGEAAADFAAWLIGIQKSISSSHAISIANAVCVQKRISESIRPEFIEKVRNDYAGELLASEDIVSAVNKWVKKATNGMIDQIADDSMKDMLACLLNAVSFEAKWREEYEEDDIYDDEFTDADGNVKEVPFLHSSEQYYIEDDGFTGFTRPYKDTGFVFMALLPKKKRSQSFLVRALKNTNLTDLYQSRTDQYDLRVSMPEFESSFNDDLTAFCREVGIEKVFTEEADFTPMSSEWLKADSIIHKARIEVNRQGTKASAVSAMVVVAGCAPDFDRMKCVELNRPFLYAIVHEDTGLPVFTGILNRL